MVARGVNEEKNQDAGKVLVKIEAVLAPALQLPSPRTADCRYPAFVGSVARRAVVPSVPPPLA